MKNILISGSNGFIGQYLSYSLDNKDNNIIQSYRQFSEEFNSSRNCHFAVGNINSQTQWQSALADVNVIVHLAARVHVMKEAEADPLMAFREVNTDGTLNLAKQAIKAGVKRFIYLSSIKVNGEETANSSFYADDEPNPQDPYAVSKFEAEQKLLALSQETGLEVVIIRPPLVYGPNVKGNFNRLINLVEKSIPLPLAGIKNSRSLVNIQNLCSFIEVCVTHPKAADEIFLVSDGQDLSTSELVEKIAQALDKKSRLFYLPKGVIKLFAGLIERQAEFERLFGSLQVDIEKNRELLGWEPVITMDEQLKKTAEAYLKNEKAL